MKSGSRNAEEKIVIISEKSDRTAYREKGNYDNGLQLDCLVFYYVHISRTNISTKIKEISVCLNHQNKGSLR